INAARGEVSSLAQSSSCGRPETTVSFGVTRDPAEPSRSHNAHPLVVGARTARSLGAPTIPTIGPIGYLRISLTFTIFGLSAEPANQRAGGEMEGRMKHPPHLNVQPATGPIGQHPGTTGLTNGIEKPQHKTQSNDQH